jgi:hypothetical protein
MVDYTEKQETENVQNAQNGVEQPEPPQPVAQETAPEPEPEVVPSKRKALNKTIQFVWLIAGALQGLIGIRILLKLMAANPDSGFARLVYGTTDLFLNPFMNLVGNPQMNGAVLEVSSLIAMLVYALFFWLMIQLIWLLFR